MQWDDLRHLLALHRGGSLAEAGIALGVAKSTVYRRLEALNESLGAELFRRTPGGYVLTPAGLRAVAAAEAVEHELGTLREELRGLDVGGVVTLTAPGWFCGDVLIPALPAFRARHPGVELRMVSTADLLGLDVEIDVAVRNVRPDGGSHRVRLGGHIGLGLYGSDDYLARQGVPTTRGDLSAHHFVAWEQRIAHSEELAWIERLAPAVSFRANSPEAQCEAVRVGLGLGLLPCLLGDREPALRRLDHLQPPTREAIWVVLPARSVSVPRVRAVSEWIVERFASEAQRLLGLSAGESVATR